MMHNEADTFAFRALILHLRQNGGRLELKDDGRPVFESIHVEWTPSSIIVELRLPPGAMQIIDDELTRLSGTVLCDDCPPVGADVPTRCGPCPRKIVGERE